MKSVLLIVIVALVALSACKQQAKTSTQTSTHPAGPPPTNEQRVATEAQPRSNSPEGTLASTNQPNHPVQSTQTVSAVEAPRLMPPLVINNIIYTTPAPSAPSVESPPPRVRHYFVTNTITVTNFVTVTVTNFVERSLLSDTPSEAPHTPPVRRSPRQRVQAYAADPSVPSAHSPESELGAERLRTAILAERAKQARYEEQIMHSSYGATYRLGYSGNPRY